MGEQQSMSNPPETLGPRSLRRLVQAGLLALLGAVALAWATSSYADTARVGEVRVEGNARVSEVAVRHLADVYEGDPLLLLDLDEVVGQVTSHPWVSEASVRRSFPDVVVIEVVEHEAVMLLHHPGGSLYRLNSEGEAFVKARNEDLDLPILTGVDADLIDDQGPVAARIVQEALGLLGDVRDCESLDEDELSELHFDRRLGFSLRLRSGSEILLGWSDAPELLDRLDAMVANGLDLDSPVEVDLDMDGLAVVTPRT